MKKNISLFLFFIVLILGGSCSRASSFDCTSYEDKRISLPAADAELINKTLISIKKRNLRDLRSVSDGKLLLVRRFVSGEANNRGGNFWLRLSPNQIDKDMKIRINGQVLTDFSRPMIFDSLALGTGISINRKICEKANRCDILPMGDDLEHLLYGLMRCDKNGKGIFIFSDGALVLDMEMISETPIGTGLFFTRQPLGYRLSSLIDFQ